MKNAISNKTTDRIRYRYFDYSDRIVFGSAAHVSRLLAESVGPVWDGVYNYAVHERFINGEWVAIDESRN